MATKTLYVCTNCGHEEPKWLWRCPYCGGWGTFVEETILEEKPEIVVVDSIQTLYSPELSGAPGGVGQVRECAARLMRLAKSEGIAVILVGHVTKEGSIAGPRVLEHMVDTVLQFEGDRFQSFRVLRALKNRFG